MFFRIGIATGGMVPICQALLAEAIPARYRGCLMIPIADDVAGA